MLFQPAHDADVRQAARAAAAEGDPDALPPGGRLLRILIGASLDAGGQDD
jgi:hypothetical protein